LKRKYTLTASLHTATTYIEYGLVEICLIKTARRAVNRKTKTEKEKITELHPKRKEDND
jgi:hypothetical protein